MTRRTQRLNDLLQEELSLLLQHQVRDPRLSPMLTVTVVKVAPDLSIAQVFISVLGTPEEKQQAMAGLASATGYLRRQLAQRLSLRHTPQLLFQQDDSLQQGAETFQLIKKVSGEEQARAAKEEE